MIRVESISISRFRGIREGEVKGFADVNLLIGRNNCGKSTVAEAITYVLFYASGQQGTDPLARAPTEVWTHARKNSGPPSSPECWYKQDRSMHIQLKAELKAKTASASCEFVVLPNGYPHAEPPGFGSDRDDPLCMFAQRETTFLPGDALNQDIENGLWPEFLHNRRDKALAKALNHIFPMGVESLNLLPDRRLFLLFPDYGLPLDVQGDGARAALRCLMMLTALQGTLLIIEEPECHQHPGSLERFAEALCRQAKEQAVQLLISTHSLECVDRFLKAAQAAGSESAVFHLKLTDGLLQATKLPPASVEAMEASGIDVRNLDLYG